MAQVDGLASGIKYNDIIDAMINADRASTAVMETRKATFQSRLDAVRSLNTKLLSFQLDLATLSRTSTYNARSASSSNASALGATASANAVTGSYQFEVVSTARANQVATAAQPSSSAQLGAGTVEIQLGAGAVTSIAIDGTSSSLGSIAQAINAKGLGVSASVISDGGGSRLLLSAKDTGSASAVTVNGTGALTGLFTGMTTVQAASDAQLRIGSGAGAITLTQSSNTFKEVIQGVTLTAAGTGTATITVGNDTKGVKDAVSTFVESYNSLSQFMTDNASYNATSNKSGVLFSESDVRLRFNTITQSLLQSVKNRPLDLATLSSVGIGIDRQTGKLTFDDAAFDAKVSADPVGVSRLFANGGTSSDPGVQFGLLGDKTNVTSPFSVAITTAAAQAKVGATADLDASTLIDSSNRDLTVTVGGRAYALQLAEGTYTRQQLSAHVQAVLAQGISLPADKVAASLDGDGLSLTGTTYGIAATLGVTGSALSALRLSTNVAYGRDVAGTINGQAASGTGQVLSGAAGSAADGLRLTVTATAPTTATVTVTKGIAQLASERVKGMTDSSTGLLLQKQDALQKSIDAIAKSVTEADARLAQRRARYQAQFLAMEKSINQSNSLSSYFASQVKGFENAASASSK